MTDVFLHTFHDHWEETCFALDCTLVRNLAEWRDMCPSVHPSVQSMQSDTIIIIGDWTLISGRKFVGQNCWAFPTWELRVWWICTAQVNAPGCMPGRRETLQQFRLLRCGDSYKLNIMIKGDKSFECYISDFVEHRKPSFPRNRATAMA